MRKGEGITTWDNLAFITDFIFRQITLCKGNNNRKW